MFALAIVLLAPLSVVLWRVCEASVWATHLFRKELAIYLTLWALGLPKRGEDH